MRVFAALLLIASPLLTQGIPVIPFSMNGGPMQVNGTFSVGPGGTPVCSGVANINGETGTFGPGTPTMSGSVAWWRFAIHLDEATYIVHISVNPNAPLGQQLGGFWYTAGDPAPPTRLVP